MYILRLSNVHERRALCILRTFNTIFFCFVLFSNGCSDRWSVSSNIKVHVFNTQLIKEMKENKSMNIKWYLDDLKINNWLTALLLKSYDSVIQSIYNNIDWQFCYAIANLRRLLGPLWVRCLGPLRVPSGFALGPLRVRSGSALANTADSLCAGFALGPLSVRLRSVDTVLSYWAVVTLGDLQSTSRGLDPGIKM
jgi:hypothetical protein